MTKREILETMRAHLKTMRRKCAGNVRRVGERQNRLIRADGETLDLAELGVFQLLGKPRSVLLAYTVAFGLRRCLLRRDLFVEKLLLASHTFRNVLTKRGGLQHLAVALAL